MSSVPASGIQATRTPRAWPRLRLFRVPPGGQLSVGGATHSWLAVAAALGAVSTVREYVSWFAMFDGLWHARLLLPLLLAWCAHGLAAACVLAHVDARFRGAGEARVPPLASLAAAGLRAALGGWAVEVIYSLMRSVLEHQAHRGLGFHPEPIVFFGFYNLTLTSLVLLVYSQAARGQRAAEALEVLQVNEARLARELASARLQVLKAQIEPHFIFNVLANVRRLIRTDRRAADALLGDMLRYLEQALPALREERSTLGRERELVRAFLAIHQVRMGERLRYAIDIPDDMAQQPVPAMALLTLVENALKHGLNPLVEGGRIGVTARRRDDAVVLEVADTGQGMGSGLGHGTGLANVRAQLRLMFGPRASLQLSVNDPRGVVATLRMPVQA